MQTSDTKKQPKKPIKKAFRENPVSPAYPVIDTDLARDNLENDLSAADRQDV